MSASYQDMLRDPRWQKRRLEIMSRAGFKCQRCSSDQRTLNVHHKKYRVGALPWEYTDSELECICEDCHLEHHILEEIVNADPDQALEEAIEAARILGTQTPNYDTRVSAFRVMAGLIGRRSPQQIERMEVERGLR